MGGLIALALEGVREGLMTRSASSALGAFRHGAAMVGADASWIAAYGVLAAVVSVVVFVAADAVRPAGVAAPGHRVMMSVAAGMLWPVLCIGLVQLGVLAGLGQFAVRANRSAIAARR
jgi:hypothetical protein